MAKSNSHYLKIPSTYIFPIIEEKERELKRKFPDADIINLGIGDISLPLSQTVAKAICDAVNEMTLVPKGYGPSFGFNFLREAIAKLYTNISFDEVFISDGTNTDASNLPELFDESCTVAITDPTYPVYRDACIMGGRFENILYLSCTEENAFTPQPPDAHCDFIYLCSPNNPTGQALTYSQLEEWVAYAKEHKSIIIFDAAYSCFITSPDVPKTIYAIEGADEVAIELNTFSKSAGFTGLRCAWSVVPKKLGDFHTLWRQRQSTKSNGVSYPIQRGALASLSLDGRAEVEAQIDHYKQASAILRKGLPSYYGGVDSPYIWMKTPDSMSSWECVDMLLNECQLITVPGSGFGSCGEGYVRFSCFTSPDTARKALDRLMRTLPRNFDAITH